MYLELHSEESIFILKNSSSTNYHILQKERINKHKIVLHKHFCFKEIKKIKLILYITCKYIKF